jgi:hypothetical protein
VSEPVQPYADAVAALMSEGYRLEEITEPEVVQQALDSWVRQMVDTAIAHHAAANGNGHQAADRCESWHALHDCLTFMHDNSRRFVQDLLTPKPGARS